MELARRFIPDNQLCAACRYIHTCYEQKQTEAFLLYRKSLIEDIERWSGEFDNLSTGKLYQTRKSFKRGVFRFNPGKEQKSVPDYNPYTIRRCRDCDIAKGKLKLAFVPDNELCAACEILQKCVGDRTKSQTAIERKHYMHEMEPLLSRKVDKVIEGGRLNVGFTKEGNKHLFSDTFGRTRIITKEDLKDLATYLENAEYVDDSALTHPRTDYIEHFYYFKVQVNGRWVRLNVAKEARIRRNGQIQVQYFLYSVNDIVE